MTENGMPEREKVIKGLECCAAALSCDECPYNENKECNNKGFFYSQAIEDALALLKEQEAKKPIYNAEKYGDYLPHCPSCEKVLPNSSQYGRAKFCHRCGQAVKWDD